MKKIISLVVSLSLVTQSFAGLSSALVVTNGQMLQLPTVIPGAPLKIYQVSVASIGTNVSSVQLVDTYTNSLLYTNAGYTSLTTYATNLVTSLTNYYGATNFFTNLAILDVTNTTAATTNSFRVLAAISTPTNQTTTVYTINANAVYGLWVTNTGSGTSTVTVQYAQ